MLFKTSHLKLCFIQRRFLHSSYMVFPMTRAQEQEKQACYLTNTIIQDGFVGKRNDRILSDAARDEMVEAMRRNIIEVNYFHRDEEVSWRKKTSDNMIQRIKSKFKAEYSSQIILGLIKVLWSSNVAR